MIQRETISIEYGKVLSKDYNSIKMTIKETYRVSGEVDFNRKEFVMMKCQDFEAIIDAKVSPENNVALPKKEPATVTEKYPQTAPTQAKDEPEFRLDNRQQKKYKCPDCGKLDRLEKYKVCYSCNQKQP